MNLSRWVVLFLAVAVFAANAVETNLTITVDGITYSNCTFGTVTPSFVSIVHSKGAASIPLAKLSPELQKRFGYDPQKVAADLKAQQQREAEAILKRGEQQRAADALKMQQQIEAETKRKEAEETARRAAEEEIKRKERLAQIAAEEKAKFKKERLELEKITTTITGGAWIEKKAGVSDVIRGLDIYLADEKFHHEYMIIAIKYLEEQNKKELPSGYWAYRQSAAEALGSEHLYGHTTTDVDGKYEIRVYGWTKYLFASRSTDNFVITWVIPIQVENDRPLKIDFYNATAQSIQNKDK